MSDFGAAGCRFCGGTEGTVVLDLGYQPLCEVFPTAGDDAADDRHRLRMWMCHRCDLAQLAEDPHRPAEDLPVVESAATVGQMRHALDWLGELGVLRTGSDVVEFGSPHGGSWLPELLRRGARDVAGTGTGADVVIDVFGLLHEPDQRAALRGRAAALAPGGSLVVQMHGLATALEHREFGELRHGHYAYWSSPSLAAALWSVGLGVHRARLFPYDRGTVVLVANRDPRPDRETLALLATERLAGVTDPATLSTLQHSADEQAARFAGWLRSQRDRGRIVVAYGAASRAVPLLCRAGVDRSDIAAVADAAPAKQGRRMPGTDIPIVSPDELRAIRPDQVVLTLSTLLDEVRGALPFVEERGGRWVTLERLTGPDAVSHR